MLSLRKKRKEKSTPFGVHVTRSLVIYQGAQSAIPQIHSIIARITLVIHIHDSSKVCLHMGWHGTDQGRTKVKMEVMMVPMKMSAILAYRKCTEP